MAKDYLRRILSGLGEEIDRGTPVVVLEPSCCSVFRDELTNLFPRLPRAERLKKQTFTLSEFLERQAGFSAPPLRRKAVVHGHCHHKAIMRMKAEESLFKKIELDYEMLDSGCCGMAGSFGFEKDKYELSVSVGERALLPAVRRAERSTFLIADGFSCREQISQLTEREALHTAEVLSLAMRNRESHGDKFPESEIVERRNASRKRSMLKAGAITTAALGVIGLAVFSARGK
jgi:Fe-S oxidoreductase